MTQFDPISVFGEDLQGFFESFSEYTILPPGSTFFTAESRNNDWVIYDLSETASPLEMMILLIMMILVYG